MFKYHLEEHVALKGYIKLDENSNFYSVISLKVLPTILLAVKEDISKYGYCSLIFITERGIEILAFACI
jgi:NurA-like 5'-3' nuclease